MNKYILFCAATLATHQSNSMEICSEIAINTHGKAIVGEDARGKHRLFVPIILYRNGTTIRGGFIPWKAVCDADDGDEIIDKYHSKRKKERFLCNQANTCYNQKTFKQALAEVMQKEK